MYQRIKQSIYSGDTEHLEDVKVDKYNDQNDALDYALQYTLRDAPCDAASIDTIEKDNKKNTFSNKISNAFSYTFKGFATYLASGVSKSWFITCCLGIYTKHYFIYKLSKKTPSDYNNMVKNITSKMADKNIFFTKIFQALANNNNLVDKDLFHHFITYTDNVKYNTYEIDYNGLYDLINIARKHGDELSIESETPIKSGNIALVYNGNLNGKNVIIKYRRTNIIEKFKKSIDELELLVNISKKIPYLCDLNISDLFEENREIMTNQLNFLNEVKNINIFYEKFNEVNTICVPKVYSYFTDDNPCAIVMDKLEGSRIENILHEDKCEYSKILSRFNLKCVFYDSIYHADLHSGNIIFMKESYTHIDENNNQLMKSALKIGIIDYGIIGTMTREEQNIFFMFFKILVSKNHTELSKFITESLSEKIDKSKPTISEGHKNILVNQISNICINVLSTDTKFFGGEEIYEINKILKTQNLQFSKFFCRVELAIAISENVCNSLATNSSYIEQMMLAFKDIFGDNIDELL
jgi:predicted unusual protein kinase regulating ubiquinone biosynthesis (AarF/ABC1/UbiB family)